MVCRAGLVTSSSVMAMLACLAVAVAAGQRLAAETKWPSLRWQLAAVVARDLQLSDEIRVLAGKLDVLNPAPSLPPDAQLRVTSMQSGPQPGTWWLRVDCTSRRDCLPFHVILRAPQASMAHLRTEPPGKPVPEAPRLGQGKAPLARAGDRVLLVEELPGMRLKVGAICLQSGGLGDAIKVRNLATHRVLMATITGKNEIRVQ